MKHILVIIILLLLNFVLFAQSKAKIGMSMEEFQALYPKTKSALYQNTTTLSIQDTLYNLPGQWGYRFDNNKLNWIHFDKYIDEINQRNFDLCVSASQEIIKNFTKAYGKPDTLITGNTNFIDPYQKHHWGYDVIEARWKEVSGMKIKVEFTFMGGKGEYHFLVVINYFEKNYPYFE
jgi:hypothetical protein